MSGSAKQTRQQFKKLEHKKEVLLKEIISLPEEIYFHQPLNGGWSVAQAVNHIFLSEKLSLAYLQKKISYPENIPLINLKSRGAIFFLKMVLRSPYKAKAPVTLNMQGPQNILSQEELVKEWGLLRMDIITFIEIHEPAFGKHLVYRHPYAGRLTMLQMLIFLNEHFASHMRQIKKIIKYT